jgi:hypothetical protein
MSKQVANGYTFEWCLLEAYRRQGVPVIRNVGREGTLLKHVNKSPEIVEQSMPIATALIKKLIELEPKTISVTAVGGKEVADLRCQRDGATDFDISAKHGSGEVYGPRFSLKGLHYLPVRGEVPSDYEYAAGVKHLQEEISELSNRFQTWKRVDAENRQIRFDLSDKFRDLVSGVFKRLDKQYVPQVLVGLLGSNACYIVESKDGGEYGLITPLNFDGVLSYGKKLQSPTYVKHVDDVEEVSHAVDLTLMPGHWTLRYRVHTRVKEVEPGSVGMSVTLRSNPAEHGRIHVRP